MAPTPTTRWTRLTPAINYLRSERDALEGMVYELRVRASTVQDSLTPLLEGPAQAGHDKAARILTAERDDLLTDHFEASMRLKLVEDALRELAVEQQELLKRPALVQAPRGNPAMSSAGSGPHDPR